MIPKEIFTIPEPYLIKREKEKNAMSPKKQPTIQDELEQRQKDRKQLEQKQEQERKQRQKERQELEQKQEQERKQRQQNQQQLEQEQLDKLDQQKQKPKKPS